MSRLRSLLWCTALFSGLCAASQFGNLPLSFEPNQGQTDPRVRYLARSGNMVVFLTGDGYTLSTAGQSVSMQITGAAQTATRLTPEGPVGGVSNYYLSGRAITGIPHFERVRAQGIRPGIDGIFYGRDRQVEYDFILQPGADSRSLTLRFTGAGRPKIDTNGDLVLRSGDIEFRHHKPLALQGGKPVECAYAVAPNGDVRFHLGAYDPNRPLTIDPILSYSTLIGAGGSGASPRAIAADSSGSAYIAGYVYSSSYPITTGGVLNGEGDAFVTKLSPNGNSLVYSTYIGGSGRDEAFGIAVDSSGNAYVVGSSESTDFVSRYPGHRTGFAAKLGPSGALVYAAALGGPDAYAQVIAVDASGAAYVAGCTPSPGSPRRAPHKPLTAETSTHSRPD